MAFITIEDIHPILSSSIHNSSEHHLKSLSPTESLDPTDDEEQSEDGDGAESSNQCDKHYWRTPWGEENKDISLLNITENHSNIHGQDLKVEHMYAQGAFLSFKIIFAKKYFTYSLLAKIVPLCNKTLTIKS